MSPPGRGTQGSHPRSLIVDSGLALEWARASGVPEDVPVRTASPGLLAEGRPGVQAIDAGLDPHDVLRLSRETVPLTRAVHDAALSAGMDHDDAIVLARAALRFPTMLVKAACLDDRDCAEPVAVVRFGLPPGPAERRLNGPWAALLSANPHLQVIDAPADRVPVDALRSQSPMAPLHERVRLESIESMGFRARVWFGALRSPRDGEVLVLSENSLIKEVGSHLARHGAPLRRLHTPDVNATQPEPAELEQLTDMLASALHPHVAARVPEGVLGPLMRLFGVIAGEARARLHAALPVWRTALDGRSTRPAAILLNFPAAPEHVALHRVCRERGIPVVSAQHGVTRELNEQSAHAGVGYEHTASDLLLVYNDEARAVVESTLWSGGRAVAVGMPRDYWRAGRHRPRRRGHPPVFYISSVHYGGNVQAVQSGGPDQHKSDFERALIEQVLDRLPHRVLFKGYPAHAPRYLDPDPIREAAQRATNLTVYEGESDLRYLLPDARVLIASLGMSTVGWCLMSDRPVVYLDLPDLAPLRPGARAGLAASVFLFDASSTNFHEDLRAFLGQPLGDIERAWNERAQVREEFCRRFIHGGTPGAGERGADAIRALATRPTARWAP